MKHSEMLAYAGIIFLARSLPRWAAVYLAIIFAGLSAYLTAASN